MRWRNQIVCAFCLLLGLLFAVGNVWIAAQRSMIPLGIDDQIDRKQLRREKHPGKDDVHLLLLQSGRTIQVDADVAKAVAEGETLHKKKWSRTLQHGANESALTWSRDFYGMCKAMPTIMVFLLTTTVIVQISHRRAPRA